MGMNYPQMNHGMSHTMVVSQASTSMGPSALTMSTVLLVTLVHTAAMLSVAAVLAIVFFELYAKSGLTLLRHTWLNFDLLWACALLVAAVAVPLS